jgi:hypothetical protein
MAKRFPIGGEDWVLIWNGSADKRPNALLYGFRVRELKE